MKAMTPKRPAKDERQRLILLKLIEIYLESGYPVGSSTLREHGFLSLSSATIRNYFSKLEQEGYLKQQHSSGGRIPTDKGFKVYAENYLHSIEIEDKAVKMLEDRLSHPEKEVAFYLQRVAEVLAEITRCATFISSPRFDQDFIIEIKLVSLDIHRALCVLLTDFGAVHTEILYLEKGFAGINLQKIAQFLKWRIFHAEKPKLSPDEELVAQRFYKEVMLRHIIFYSNYSAEEIYKTGFSKLLEHPDFNTASSLAGGLALFENEKDLRFLLKKGCEEKKLCSFIGEDFHSLSTSLSGCTVLVIPYRIHQTIAGAMALFGPTRLPYKKLFGLLQVASSLISEALTQSLYKFKITFRSAHPSHQLGLEYHQRAALNLFNEP